MRGSSCIYVYPETGESSPLVACRDFQRGVCRRGGACRFVHSFPVQPPPAPLLFPFQDSIVPAASPFFMSAGHPPPFPYILESNRPQRENLQICFDFLLKGACHRNSNCSYLHVHLAEGEENNARLLKRRVDNLPGQKNDKSNSGSSSSNSNSSTNTNDAKESNSHMKDVNGNQSLGLSLSSSHSDEIAKLLEELRILKQENLKLRTYNNAVNNQNQRKTTASISTEIDLENTENTYEEDEYNDPESDHNK